jgi:hypothetical protein
MSSRPEMDKEVNVAYFKFILKISPAMSEKISQRFEAGTSITNTG